MTLIGSRSISARSGIGKTNTPLRFFRVAVTVLALALIGSGAVARAQAFSALSEQQALTAALIQGSDGLFYGTTWDNGTYSSGTVFKMDSAGNLTVLYSFGATSTDGRNPYAPLIQAQDGFLYGTTEWGGANTPSSLQKVLSQGFIAYGIPLQWQVAGVDDFNGDGKADILWRNIQTGDVYLWEMNGLTIAQQGFVAYGIALQWQIAGVGDFNGKGIADVLWRNIQTGDVYLWEMNGAAIANQGYLYHDLPLVWQIEAP